MAREIKTKFVLEGEQKYKQGMRDAANAVRLLNSEEKLAKAQFEQTGDAQEYQARKVELLKEKIEAQKGAVQAAMEALKELKARGGENSQTAQEWTIKLNNANTTLTKMQTELAGAQAELDGTSDAMDDAGAAAQDFDGELRKIGQGVNYQTTIEAIDRVSGALGTIIKTAARAVSAVWSMEGNAGKWADDLATAAQQAGLDVETYQSWEYASRFIDTSVDKIIDSRQKLIKKMSDGSDDTMKAFNQLGVATRNADGSLRDGTKTFFDVIDALGRIDDQTTRDALAMELLGRGIKELNPLINAGSPLFRQYADEGREVAVVSEEQVNKLTELDDANQKLQATLEKTKYDTLSNLAPVFTEIAEAMQKAVQSFNDFLKTDEGQEALDGLREALEGIADTITNIDPRDVIDMARQPIEWITNALKWIAENGETVRNISVGIVAAWGVLKIAPPVLSFLHLIKGINWGSVGAGAGKLAESVGAGGVARTAGGLLSKVNPYAKAVAAGAAISYGIDKAAINRQYGDYFDAVDKSAERMEAQGSAKIYALQTLYGELEETIARIDDANGEEAMAEASAALARLLEQETAITELLGNGLDIPDWLREGGVADISGLYKMDELLAQLYADIGKRIDEESEAAGQAVPDGMAAGIDAGAGNVEAAAGEMAQGVDDAVRETLDIHSPSGVMIANGEMVAEGVAQGIYNRAAEAIEAARWLAAQVQTVMAGALKIHSPSRVMEEMGGYVAQGFALGIEDGARLVDDALGRMIQATSAAPERPGRRMSAGGGMAVAGEGGELRAYIVMDRQIVGEMVAPVVDGWIGAEIATGR